MVSWLQVTAPEHGGREPCKESEYERSRARMTAEVNAAVRGALDGGATEIIVNDFHGGNRNIRLDNLHPGCRLVSGGAGPLNMLQGIDQDFAGIFFTGFHAKAGTLDSALAHTWTTWINDLRINGRSTGEFGLIGYIAGHFGVPVLFVSGDDKAVAQTGEFLGRPVEGAVVKVGISQTGAIHLHPAAAQLLIEKGARRAMEEIGRLEPVRLDPGSLIEIDFDHHARADASARLPFTSRPENRTVSFEASSGIELLDRFLLTVKTAAISLSP